MNLEIGRCSEFREFLGMGKEDDTAKVRARKQCENENDNDAS